MKKYNARACPKCCKDNNGVMQIASILEAYHE